MREHGTYEMGVYDQIITLKVFGAWNLETTKRWCSEYRDHIQAVKSNPWARIIDLTFWQLTTPDVWEIVDDVNIFANDNNQKYEVVICPLSIQKEILGRAHQVLTNVEIEFCDSLPEAYQWLARKGLKHDEMRAPGT
ncbi:hypothetical protein [Aestuariirhabdus sp. LZHN29]|uniref:hypothetical protein n=1 Tax=Aestuariirhabdus sp. LZHN29 TaxID=3417462 RepID=UPI003CEFDAE8